MEKSLGKLESTLDILCELVFGTDLGVSISGDIYNMIFEDKFDIDDIISYMNYCRDMINAGCEPDFDDWYKQTNI